MQYPNVSRIVRYVKRSPGLEICLKEEHVLLNSLDIVTWT